ncbi:hypothetical protein LCGC14_2120310 [marine sediment metagenome]|uniref:Lipoprotein n=1 Tax=marine sediment metagenome TaxID=412755 RepID=A0A0F9E4J3_9ZZZZ
MERTEVRPETLRMVVRFVVVWLALCALLAVGGCGTIQDFLISTPRGQEIQAAIDAKANDAYRRGESSAFKTFHEQVGPEKQYSKLQARDLQDALDLAIKGIADPNSKYTTGTIENILRSAGVPEGSAIACKAELNDVLDYDPMLGTAFVEFEHRKIIQSYLDGYFAGLKEAMKPFDIAAGITWTEGEIQ